MRGIESKHIAEKVEQIVRSKNGGSDLSQILVELQKINRRLDDLEAVSNFGTSISNSVPIHPSQQRFEIAEAIADAVFNGVAKEKACTFEPNGKPCDHCSMCSSRGF
jgi:hypothetical protein